MLLVPHPRLCLFVAAGMENDRLSFLAEPDALDAGVDEDAADVLERQLSEIAIKMKEGDAVPATATPTTTSYGTFENRVGIGNALAQLPELEPLGNSAGPSFGAVQEDAIDRIVDLERRVEKKRLRGAASYGNLSPKIHAAVEAKVARDAEALFPSSQSTDNAVPYDGILDIFTKKGRKKMKDKKDRVNKAIHEEKARIIEERLKDRKEKAAESSSMKAVMTPSERLARERLSSSSGDLPVLHDPATLYGGTKGERRAALRMKAIEDQTRKPGREHERKLERLMKSLAPPERALYGHIAEVVRHGPNEGLQAVESAYKAATLRRSSDLNYLGALAMGAVVGKIRAANPATIKREADEFHAQATTPMDAAKATTFANALLEYSTYVRRMATTASSDHTAQAEVAVSLGGNLADALLQHDNHVPLTAVTGRLFESVLHSAVPDEKFVQEKVKSFWATELNTTTWKAVTQKHFA